MENNPIVGTGFESFWLGARAQTLWDKYWWRPNQAHNGYIETYINLGIVGLILLSGMIVSGYVKAQKSFMIDPYYGRIRFGLLLPIVIFNYTDATFKALHILYFVFFLIVIDLPYKRERSPHSQEPRKMKWKFRTDLHEKTGVSCQYPRQSRSAESGLNGMNSAQTGHFVENLRQ
jgi:hypothetical protein